MRFSIFSPGFPPLDGKNSAVLRGALKGIDALAVAEAAARNKATSCIHISANDAEMEDMRESLIVNGVEPSSVMMFPAWDCLPYDRVSPNATLVGHRLNCLAQLVRSKSARKIVLTTVNAWIQRIPRPDFFNGAELVIKTGSALSFKEISVFAEANAYQRVNTVHEGGEYAIRGGIVDIFPPGAADPVRIDLFGDRVEEIKVFDPETQRSQDTLKSLALYPVSEILLNDSSINHFRRQYVEIFGAAASRDEIYHQISEGRRFAGIEQLLPLFHTNLGHLTDYFSNPLLIQNHETLTTAEERLEQIQDFYEARLDTAAAGSNLRRARGSGDGGVVRPLLPGALYETMDEIKTRLETNRNFHISPFSNDEKSDSLSFDIKSKTGTMFYQMAKGEGGDVFATLADFISRNAAGKTIILAAHGEGSKAHIIERLGEKLDPSRLPITSVNHVTECKAGKVHAVVWGLEHGFILPDTLLITEQDIYGSRLSRPQRRKRRADNFLREASSLSTGDLVVHLDHGIGRYEGLETISTGTIDHDCLLLSYAGDDRLYLPVENIELLSRFGSDSEGVVLDRLGGAAWQARKSRIKGKIKDIADSLIKTAVMREAAKAEAIQLESSTFAEFCQRFPYVETEDQADAITDVINDMAEGRVMDRLVCGDVGFGKTEVALRAAFAAVMAGYQVAVVAPTTLLSRQHSRLFTERFEGFGVKIGELSRMTPAAKATATRKALASGDCHIAIGTHALLSKAVTFNNLGLVVIDEEQHFGVTQKERLKTLRGDIHVLTLTATPIPRTLQMALSGVRDMSIIATPPIDRLAIRTSVAPWDAVVLTEAIRREHHRGGQVFCVSPRIDFLPRVYDRLNEIVPSAKIITVHGQQPPHEIDEGMTRFADGRADILLSTNIIESGLDIPSANTIIIHRADLFGLSQLYQLRGRVGRGKHRAYAYLTTEPSRRLTANARRRLEVLQTLDSLGAGFSLASYDLDIRGAGNLLGDEQSGHVREVGVELYQDMLNQAVQRGREGSTLESGPIDEEVWLPTINLGASVLIPEDYVRDLAVRLSLYRRIAAIATEEERDALTMEMIDRFGAIPDQVRNLLDTISIRITCRQLRIEKIDAGPKGISISFKNNSFPRPDALINLIAREPTRLQVTADQRLIVKQVIPISERFAKVIEVVDELAGLI